MTSIPRSEYLQCDASYVREDAHKAQHAMPCTPSFGGTTLVIDNYTKCVVTSIPEGMSNTRRAHRDQQVQQPLALDTQLEFPKYRTLDAHLEFPKYNTHSI